MEMNYENLSVGDRSRTRPDQCRRGGASEAERKGQTASHQGAGAGIFQRHAMCTGRSGASDRVGQCDADEAVASAAVKIEQSGADKAKAPGISRWNDKRGAVEPRANGPLVAWEISVARVPGRPVRTVARTRADVTGRAPTARWRVWSA